MQQILHVTGLLHVNRIFSHCQLFEFGRKGRMLKIKADNLYFYVLKLKGVISVIFMYLYLHGPVTCNINF
jgi:hypothetical protein